MIETVCCGVGFVEGVELVSAALAAGAAAGVSNTASAAVADAYAGLKNVLVRLLPLDRRQEIADSNDVQSIVWQSKLEDSDSVVVWTNPEVIDAARRLLNLASDGSTRYHVDVRFAKGIQVGDHNIQHNNFSLSATSEACARVD